MISISLLRYFGDKYVITEYQHPNTWRLQKLKKESEIPEDIRILICGSRQPILFVEGDNDSLDNLTYQKVYPDHKVISVGSCEKVKTFTKSFGENNNFHHLKCFGIIDGDSLSEENKQKLKKDNIHTLPVAIIENLFLLPRVAECIYEITGEVNNYNKEEFINKVTTWIDKDSNWKVKVIKERLLRDAKQKIFDLGNKIDSIEESIIISPRSEKEIFENQLSNIEKDNQENKLTELLKICRGKHLLPKLAGELGLRNKTSLENKIIGNIGNEKLINMLREILPKIC